MGWRRDETWFDAELDWLLEPSAEGAASLEIHAPSFWKLTAEALESKIPDGLAESRRRRADRRRRRSARRTRAAALMVGPAMALTLAGPRPSGAARPTEVLREDPPSQTFRVRPNGLEPSIEARRERAETTDEAFPTIRWARADPDGLPYAGRLSSGTTLPVEGPDWVTWNPVADEVPNRSHRLYGHERTIRAVLAVSAAYGAANPDAPRIVVGDISFRHGGPMELHRSHQNGLDVDVYYPRRDGVERAPVARRQIDRVLTQDLLDRFLAAGADVIFVGYSLGLLGPNDRVVPYPNHEDHMHVRFKLPSA
ncbi:MAG TPA: penicillin-insensitive murein endopeptidase [Gaiellaceae bacterium]|nr:penicillin-insensitive murein endopeptidase [Gaiellaceae bacterium]